MYGMAHALFAFALCYIGRLPVVTGTIAALLPDTDALFHFSFPFVHRGVLHTPVTAVVAGVLVFGLTGRRASAYAMTGGWLSHLALDTLTPSGIMWLYPLRTELSLTLTMAASLPSNLGFGAVSLAVAWLWRCRWRWLGWMRRR
jgi:membrane-bound metal-dependent hydrolase YbcI (DUF457 family)